jgi:hypothetical protein
VLPPLVEFRHIDVKDKRIQYVACNPELSARERMIRDEMLYEAKRQEELSPPTSKQISKQDSAVTETRPNRNDIV